MTDAASLLETFELTCARCGRGAPDMFTDLAGVEAFLAALPIPLGVAALMPRGPQLRTIRAGDLAQFGPVHRSCLQPPKPERQRHTAPYSLERSVA